MRYLLSAINAKYIHSNPAVYSLFSYAEKMYADSGKIFPDLHISEHTINNQLDDILEDIYTFAPDVIGFSCYIWNISYIDMLIPQLKKLLPNTDIWVGGPEVSYRAASYLKAMPMVKGVFMGEGEIPFYEMLKAYDDNCIDRLSSVKGICYRQDETVINNDFAPPMDMNDLPFLYKDLGDFSNRIIYYESSRGCPFSCSYCLSSIDKQIRFRDMETVKNELLFFINRKVPQVKFIDRTFNCNPVRALDIWKFLLENDNGITNFHFEIAGDLLNKEQIKLISRMRPGLIQFEIGVQSTNLDTLKAIRRNSDLSKLRDNISLVKKGGNIHQHLDLIAGLPFEDINSFASSFNDVYSMEPDQLQLGFLKLLSGSYMKEMTNEYDIVYKSYPPYEVLSTKWLTHDNILKLKHIENVLEIYYNSGQFTNSVKYLLGFFPDPFHMYERLGEYYYTNFDTKAKHSRISRYYLLLEFFENVIAPLNSDVSQSDFKQILTLDVYLRENIKTRPEFAIDIKPHQKTITKLKKLNNLPNMAHIEPFIQANEVIYVYFDYENLHPLTKSAKLVRV